MRNRWFCSWLALSSLVFGCGETPDSPDTGTGQPSPALTLTSDDGLATLEIPAGALPVGTDPALVSVRRVESPPSVIDGASAVGAWELSLDGLVLSAPAVFSGRLAEDPEPDALHAIVHVGADGRVERPEPEWVSEGSPPEIAVRIEIMHFSRVVLFRQDSGHTSWADVDVTLSAHDTIVDGKVSAVLRMRVSSDALYESESCGAMIVSAEIGTATGDGTYAWTPRPSSRRRGSRSHAFPMEDESFVV